MNFRTYYKYLRSSIRIIVAVFPSMSGAKQWRDSDTMLPNSRCRNYCVRIISNPIKNWLCSSSSDSLIGICFVMVEKKRIWKDSNIFSSQKRSDCSIRIWMALSLQNNWKKDYRDSGKRCNLRIYNFWFQLETKTEIILLTSINFVR
jgi:hypothetical protein